MFSRNMCVSCECYQEASGCSEEAVASQVDRALMVVADVTDDVELAFMQLEQVLTLHLTP